jgi:hypothetical protein
MSSVYSEKDEIPEYWFNLKTLKVEVGKQSASEYRVGPFATRDEAESALEILRARSRDWAEEGD